MGWPSFLNVIFWLELIQKEQVGDLIVKPIPVAGIRLLNSHFRGSLSLVRLCVHESSTVNDAIYVNHSQLFRTVYQWGSQLNREMEAIIVLSFWSLS